MTSLFGDVRAVTFDRDGLAIAGRLFTPHGLDESKTYPGIVFNGAVTMVKEQAPENYARLLVQHGFVVLTFDYTSYGESEGEPRQNERRHQAGRSQGSRDVPGESAVRGQDRGGRRLHLRRQRRLPGRRGQPGRRRRGGDPGDVRTRAGRTVPGPRTSSTADGPGRTGRWRRSARTGSTTRPRSSPTTTTSRASTGTTPSTSSPRGGPASPRPDATRSSGAPGGSGPRSTTRSRRRRGSPCRSWCSHRTTR